MCLEASAEQPPLKEVQLEIVYFFGLAAPEKPHTFRVNYADENTMGVTVVVGRVPVSVLKFPKTTKLNATINNNVRNIKEIDPITNFASINRDIALYILFTTTILASDVLYATQILDMARNLCCPLADRFYVT